jgi:hypothetical protein
MPSGTSTGVTPSGVNILPSVVSSSDNTKENHGHYKVGANWTVSPMVTLRGEMFYKDHVNNYTGYGASAGGQYILGYQFYGTKLTAIVKPLTNLTFTTRLVSQSGKMDTTVDFGSQYQSRDSKNYMFGETVDWNPNNQVYVQANLNVTFSTMKTAYPRAGGVANDVLRNSDNNYYNGSLVTGFVVDKATDAQVQVTWYSADNYTPVPSSLGYGASAKEYTATVGVKHKFTDQIIGNLKLGYIDSKNDTTGGNTNFRGPLAYVSLDYAL